MSEGSIVLTFYFKDIPNWTETKLTERFPNDSRFIEAISKFFHQYSIPLQLNQIAIIPKLTNTPLIYIQGQMNVEDLCFRFGKEFTITNRSAVNGPDLTLGMERKGDMDKLDQILDLEMEDGILPQPKIPAQPSSAAPPAPPMSLAAPTPQPGGYAAKPSIKEDNIKDRAKKKKKMLEDSKKEKISGEIRSEESAKELFEEGSNVPSEFQKYHKNLAVEYYNKMNPEKIYPLILTISNIEQELVRTVENILTGERKIQKKSTMDLEVKSSIITIRPIFPGCSVVPTEMKTDLELKEDQLTFYITPIVKDDIEGRIDFLDDEDNIIHSAPAPAEVDDPRTAKTVALYGTMASVLPKVLLFFGIDAGNEIQINEILPFLQNMLDGVVLTNFIAITGAGIAFIVGIIVFLSRRPKSTRIRFKMSDFRNNRPKLIKL